jgi:hypothetical protein
MPKSGAVFSFLCPKGGKNQIVIDNSRKIIYAFVIWLAAVCALPAAKYKTETFAIFRIGEDG